jgi:hypothetical protein
MSSDASQSHIGNTCTSLKRQASQQSVNQSVYANNACLSSDLAMLHHSKQQRVATPAISLFEQLPAVIFDYI